MGSEEEEVDKESVVRWITPRVIERLKRDIPEGAIREVFDKVFPDHKDQIYCGSDSGRSEVWASPEAIEKKELKEQVQWQKKQREREERRKLGDEEYERRQEAKRLKKEAEQKAELERRALARQARIRRGGWPGPKDWSPRGRLPGDR